MSVVDDLLKQILSDEKLLGSKAFRDKVFTDVPILRKASQLKRPETPQKIRDMKAMAMTPEAYWKTSAWLFFTQGQFMADYDDDLAYSEDFVKVYPTYRDFTTEQLRGYFTWRKAVRNGDIQKAPSPYPFMYVYELLNGIGTEQGLTAFHKIDEFCKAYGKHDETLMNYREKWLSDYAIYHNLPSELLSDISDSPNESNIITLMHWEDSSAEDIYDAVCNMSSYRPEQSRYVQENPDIFRYVLCNSFIKVSEFFRDNRKNSFCSRLFGNMAETAYRIFDTAVFYDPSPVRETEYIVNEIHSYRLRNGKWFSRHLTGCRHRSAKLGDFVKAVDSIIRDETGYQFRLSNTEVSKQEKSIIRSVIAEYIKQKKIEESRRIEIDISKLSGIRKAADITRDKLIVEEEPDVEENIIEAPPVTPVNSDSALNEAETEFLSALINGGDYDAAARKYGSMTSVIADSVNEKLFDTFGDTVLLFDGDTPEIIEDYLEELKSIVNI